jgi:hypothetical protein
LAAGAEAGQSGWGEKGRESGGPGEQVGSPLGAAAAEAAGEALVARESIRHLNRCFGQAQPPAVPCAPPHLALAPTSQAERVSLEAEIPEALFDGMRAFIQARPDWDQYSLVTSALAGFLFQHGWADGCVSEHYLNGLFRDEAA